METKIPSISNILSSLLRADLTTQWRNRRPLLISLIGPVIIVITWKGLIEKLGGVFILSNGITLGLTTIGLMGYSNSIARDRDKGVFQRLRVAPIPPWSIMLSRLIVQSAMIIVMTTAVFLAGYYNDKIILTPDGYIFGYLIAFIGGAVYLGLGQAIAGLIKNPETVNAVSRLVYVLFIIVGMLGELGVMGKEIDELVKWSPYGSVMHILYSCMIPRTWNQQSSLALLITISYGLVFSIFGIIWFRWNPR